MNVSAPGPKGLVVSPRITDEVSVPWNVAATTGLVSVAITAPPTGSGSPTARIVAPGIRSTACAGRAEANTAAAPNRNAQDKTKRQRICGRRETLTGATSLVENRLTEKSD